MDKDFVVLLGPPTLVVKPDEAFQRSVVESPRVHAKNAYNRAQQCDRRDE